MATTTTFGITDTASAFGILQSWEETEKVSKEKITDESGKVVETAAVSKNKSVKVEGTFKQAGTMSLPGAGTSITLGSTVMMLDEQSIKKAAGKYVKVSGSAEIDDKSAVIAYSET